MFCEGGGLWCPEAQPLSLLRRDIDRKPHKIKRVLTDKGIRKAFLGGVADDDKKAVKAFTNQSENKSTALKKHPKVSDSISLTGQTLGSIARLDRSPLYAKRLCEAYAPSSLAPPKSSAATRCETSAGVYGETLIDGGRLAVFEDSMTICYALHSSEHSGVFVSMYPCVEGEVRFLILATKHRVGTDHPKRKRKHAGDFIKDGSTLISLSTYFYDSAEVTSQPCPPSRVNSRP